MEVLRDADNNVIGIRKTQSISLNDYTYFKIYGVDLEKPVGICNPIHIEKARCKCGGNLKITKIEQTDYNLYLEIILDCDSCSGRYLGIAERKLGE